MINLLPQDRRDSIDYARKNVLLLRWIMIILIAILLLIVIAGGSLFYLKQDVKAREESIAKNKQSLSDQKEEETLKRVSEISGRLSLVVDVLSREVVFSKLIPHIGSLIPDGAALNGLSLSRDTEGALDLSISALDYNTASQALINIQASESLLFEGADANNVTCEGITEGPYPCLVSIRAVLVKDNPFLLLNQENLNE